MSKIGYGYGSEWHLLRYLGYHRQYLTDNFISEVTEFQGYKAVLKDVKFSNSNNLFSWENEYKGIDVYSSKSLVEEWSKYWPQTGNVQNWDAILELNGKDSDEYIFVEAKAHLSEIQSSACFNYKPNTNRKGFRRDDSLFWIEKKPKYQIGCPHIINC